MKKGFLDHWVPTAPGYSRFWSSDIDTVKRSISAMRGDIEFDSFTFYTKWYTNGIKSALPFLRNNAEASNVKTGNKWGTGIIDFLHGLGMEATALLQLYTYEKPEWDPALSIGEWDVKVCAGNDDNIVIADFTSDEYVRRVKALVSEQARLFPGFDNMFFEFEGIFPHQVAALYDKWAVSNGMPSSDKVSYSEETLDFIRRTGQPQTMLWSEECRAFLRHFYRRNMRAVAQALDEAGFTGRKGVCFHIYDYETAIYPDLCAEEGDWRLVPWNYWLWTRRPFEECRAAAKDNISRWALAGHKIHYIGDVTIGSVKAYAEVLEDFYKHCGDAGVEGYIGMGYPDKDIGLRWTDVDAGQIDMARELYKKIYS